jgi:putative flippase GtrA
MHRNFTFKENNNNFKIHLIKYLLLISLSYFITILSIHYLTSIGFNLYFSKLLSVCFVYIYGYIFSRFFVFKGIK